MHRSESVTRDATGGKPRGSEANLSSGMQLVTNREARERICHPGRNRRQTVGQENRIYHPGCNRRQTAWRGRESVTRDATGDKPHGKGANLSPRTQSETNCKAGRRICHPGCNQRQTARHGGEFVIWDVTRDKLQGTEANLSSETQPETNHGARKSNLSSEMQSETNRQARDGICHTGCNRRQTVRQGSESVTQDANADKSQGWEANLSSEMQPETNRKAKERIYHLGGNRRQIAR